MIINLIHILLRAAVLIFVSFQASSAVSNKNQSLESIMAIFAEKDTSKVRFIERKTSHLLMHDLQFEGELVYRRPNYLLKKTYVPRYELVEISEGKLDYQRTGQQHRELELNNYPALNAFVKAFTSVLNGNLNQLQTLYAVEFNQRSYGWKLILSPLMEEMKEAIESIIFLGEADRIVKIIITETDGDKNTMILLRNLP